MEYNERMNVYALCFGSESRDFGEFKSFLKSRDVQSFPIVCNRISDLELFRKSSFLLKNSPTVVYLPGDDEFSVEILCASTFMFASGMSAYFIGKSKILQAEVDLTECEHFHFFEDSASFLEYFRTNFQQIELEERQKQCRKTLLDLGFPVTADCFAQFIEKNNEKMCSLFLDCGIDLNSQTSEGVSLLGIAVRCKDIQRVQWLLDRKVDINYVSGDRGYTPVMDAVWRKSYEITELLIKNGAKLDHISSDGQNIMILAVGNGDARIVKLLMDNGADADVPDSMGMSARSYAALFKKTEIVEILNNFPKKD